MNKFYWKLIFLFPKAISQIFCLTKWQTCNPVSPYKSNMATDFSEEEPISDKYTLLLTSYDLANKWLPY